MIKKDVTVTVDTKGSPKVDNHVGVVRITIGDSTVEVFADNGTTRTHATYFTRAVLAIEEHEVSV